MGYSTQPIFPTHSDCANFRNGMCMLNGVAVDSNGAACPNFTPKSMMAMPPEVKVYQEVRRPRQPYPLQTAQGYLPCYPPQTGYGLPLPYAYPLLIVYGHGYPALRQRDAGFLSMSSGRRGGGCGGRRGGGGRGRGRMGGRLAAGPGGSCVCPSCGYRATHIVGTPCYQQPCPKCGSRMTRGS